MLLSASRSLPVLSLCSSTVGTAAGEWSHVPGLGPSSRGSWSRAQLLCSEPGVPYVPDPAALELEAWKSAQAEALCGERQHTASAGDRSTVSDKILWFCRVSPLVRASQLRWLCLVLPWISQTDSRLETWLYCQLGGAQEKLSLWNRCQHKVTDHLAESSDTKKEPTFPPWGLSTIYLPWDLPSSSGSEPGIPGQLCRGAPWPLSVCERRLPCVPRTLRRAPRFPAHQPLWNTQSCCCCGCRVAPKNS